MAKNEQQSHEIWLNVYFFSCISLKVSTYQLKSLNHNYLLRWSTKNMTKFQESQREL